MNFLNMKNVSSSQSDTRYDEGLRSYMLGIYNLMGLGIALTAIVSMIVSTSPTLLNAIFSTPLKYVFMFAPLGLAMFLSFKVNSLELKTAKVLFWSFCTVMGVSLSVIFVIYRMGDIARAFFIAAGMFGAMSLYGYTTKKDLTTIGSFLIMGMIGVFIASFANLFFKSSGFDLLLSYLTVLIFVGLTAYDTQKIKSVYYSSSMLNEDTKKKLAIMGALTLYIDLLNIFLSLLRIMGSSRN